MQATIRHLTARPLRGPRQRRLSHLPTLRARLAQMRIETDRARAHLVSGPRSRRGSRDAATQLLVLEVKAAATEAAVQVTETAMRACGGAAFGEHLGLERSSATPARRWSWRRPPIRRYDFIGRALCGMELF